MALSFPPDHGFARANVLHIESQRLARSKWDQVTGLEMLVFGEDLLGAVPAEVVEYVVAVPAGPAEADLNEPCRSPATEGMARLSM